MISAEEPCWLEVTNLTWAIFHHTCYCLLKWESAMTMDPSEEQNLDQCNEAEGHGQGGVTLVSFPQHLWSSPWDTDGTSSPLKFICPIVVVSKGVELHYMWSWLVRPPLYWTFVEKFSGKNCIFKMYCIRAINLTCFWILYMWWLGNTRMRPHVWCILFILCLCSFNEEMVVGTLRSSQ